MRSWHILVLDSAHQIDEPHTTKSMAQIRDLMPELVTVEVTIVALERKLSVVNVK